MDSNDLRTNDLTGGDSRLCDNCAALISALEDPICPICGFDLMDAFRREDIDDAWEDPEGGEEWR